jgi:hypothetical protein
VLVVSRRRPEAAPPNANRSAGDRAPWRHAAPESRWPRQGRSSSVRM